MNSYVLKHQKLYGTTQDIYSECIYTPSAIHTDPEVERLLESEF